MPIELPEPVTAYFAADKRDGAAVARCFARDAVVTDEGQTHTGTTAIAGWKDAAAAKYSYTSEPVAVENTDGMTIVTCHLTGTFPGSPVDLRFFFRLERGRIASLKIVP
jgi:hypothetical protein